jgi:hypothetical protein
MEQHRESALSDAREGSAQAAVEPVAAAPVGRRELAALVAALAGLAVTSCANNVAGDEPSEALASQAEALTGTTLEWVDTVLGAVPTVLPMPPALSSPRTGDLATKNSAHIGNAIIVFAKGCVTAGDGGGGLFYWDNSSSTGDDGGTIIVPNGPNGGGGRWRRIFSGAMSIVWFGAKGDGTAAVGTTGDQVAVVMALTAASAAGRPLSGASRTYGVSGNIGLPANINLQDAAFKQLAPNAAGDVRTLTSLGASNIKLVRVTVNRNGNGTNGSPLADAGVWIDGGSGHYFEDLDVYGDDLGCGFAIHNASNFEAVRVCAHDLKYLLAADPGDDSVQGIWFNACTNFTAIDCRSRDLGGNFGSGATPRYSRGVKCGGNRDFTVTNLRCWNVDQGIDLTGEAPGNTRFAITGGMMSDCLTFGFKFANTARDGTITGAVAVRCGFAGFEVSGGSVVATNTCDLEFNGCVAYDTGSNRSWPNTYGFDIEEQPGALGETRGIRFINCKAHDRQTPPTMKIGFRNETPANTDGRYNEAINCRSIGHTVSAFDGMNQGRVEVGLSAVQSIRTDTWTPVFWNTETDLGAMYNGVDGQIYARRDGIYQITAGVTFTASGAGGRRGVRLVGVGGATIAGATQMVSSVGATGVTQLSICWTKKMVAGQDVRVEVFQDSGVDLNIQDSSGAVVQQVG